MADKPWLAQYDADVPRSLQPYPDKTLLDYLSALARDNGSKPALLFKGAEVSYAQLQRESDAFAAALATLGVGKGDRVALILPNCPQFFVAEVGAWKAGGVVCPVNPTYTERELEHALKANGAGTVVTLTPFYDRLKEVQPRTAVRNVIATSIKDYLPPVLRVLFTLLKEKSGGHRITISPGDRWFLDLLRQHHDTPPPAVPVRGDDRAVILASGGTTGTPKGVVGLHRHYVAAGLQLYEWTKSAKRAWVDAIILPLPLFHVYANVGVPLPDVEVRIVDADDPGREMAVDEVGEMLIRAPQHMVEYWNNPGETAETLRTDGTGGPWVHTGDLARMDADGFIFIVDRKKDMLKTSGFQLWPLDIEEVLAAHPAVMEVGVAGGPDQAKGEVAHAGGVLKAGQTATAEELRMYCRERLAPYKVPAQVEFRSELPKTMVGKVLRRALVAESRR